MTESLQAILRVADTDRAVAWYARLGFTKEWEHRFAPDLPAFVSVVRGSLRIFLSEHEGDARPDTLLYLWVDDLDTIAIEFDVEPERAGWDDGVREVHLSDPDGNRLRIGHRLT
jgi:catechol 2,3-dioxygenase-like lactoylglutathione lyase family enzyme